MKNITGLLWGIFFCVASTAQKQPLALQSYDDWQNIRDEQVSNDGQYVCYTIGLGIEKKLVVMAVSGSYKVELATTGEAVISNDCRYVLFEWNDSLGLLRLGTTQIKFVSNVTGFKYAAGAAKERLIVKLRSREVKLLNLHGLDEKSYGVADDYILSENGNVLLLVRKEEEGNVIEWIDFAGNSRKLIWKGAGKPGLFAFNEQVNKVCFLTTQRLPAGDVTMAWYFAGGRDSALPVTALIKDGDTAGYKIARRLPCYGAGDSVIYFSVQERDREKQPVAGAAMPAVDIWHYKDSLLQSQQLIQEKNKRTYLVAWCVGQSRLRRLERGDEQVVGDAGTYKNACLLIRSVNAYWLVNAISGDRSRLETNGNDISEMQMSPSGRYIVWYDKERRAYFTVDSSNKAVRCISGKIKVNLFNDEDDHVTSPPALGIMAWIKGEDKLWIYDKYDIWQVNLNNLETRNVTGGLGRRLHTCFRYAGGPDKGKTAFSMEITGAPLLLAAFNTDTKYNGYYKLVADERALPVELTMGPYLYYVPVIPTSSFTAGVAPVKAKNAEQYLFFREGAGEYPNLYTTKNWKDIRKLSDLAPQQSVNWLQSTLVHWKMDSVEVGEGVLYKPENFDSTRRYPVIFYFYERKADGLNRFFLPGLSDGELNVPYFVSNGYLVFEPNIYYKKGQPGSSACKAVVSAATFLATKPWVDGRRMGLYGHSFGGFEVNYIVTHSALFAAAVSAAGLVNMTVNYNEVWAGSGKSMQPYYETGQGRMGETLWEDLDGYIQNSPVFMANKVSTPLLILHNKEDEAVAFSQGVAWFTALRRLGKKVWMLQYDGESHSLRAGVQNRLDYSRRLAQFYNYYLKGALPAVWLTRGIRAGDKRIENGLQADTSGTVP